MEVRKTWKNWYRYVAGVTGGGIGAIAGLAIAAWGVYCLGFDAGGNYLSQLMHKHMGDEMYKEVATSMNDEINQNFEKMNRK